MITATPVWAATDDAPSATPIQSGPDSEITVTARRMNEKLSDVPASVTVLSEVALTRAGVTRAQDFVKLIPGVTIQTGATEAGDTTINIRGVNSAHDAESSVALVVDGILRTNSSVLNQDQGALTQVEVLKGPQGAIYGRDAAAGAIVIQTRKPSDTLTAGAKVSYASQNTSYGSAWVAGPLVPGVGFVAEGDFRHTDGFYTNQYLNNAHVVDNQTTWNLNGRLTADLDYRTQLDVKGHFGRLSGGAVNYNAVFNLPAFAASTGIAAYNENVNDHTFVYNNNIAPNNTQKITDLSAKITHDFDAMTLTAWAAYSDVRNSLVADGTSAGFQMFTTYVNPAVARAASTCASTTAALTGYPRPSPTYLGATPATSLVGAYSPTTSDGAQYQRRTQRDVSAEIRLASKPGNAYNWQAGIYYLHMDRRVIVASKADEGLGIEQQAYSAPNSVSPNNQLFDDTFHTDAYAAFASGDYNITDAFNVDVALRYDIEERRDINNVPVVLDPFSGNCINPGEGTGNVCSAISGDHRTFRQLEPKVTLRYKFGPQATLYANWGVGFKSGGFNNQGSAAIVANNFRPIGSDANIQDVYKKERTSAFEAGIKGRIGPVDYALAGYYTRVTNMQFFEFFVGKFALLRIVENIDRVDLWGGEASANIKLGKGFSLAVAGNLTDSEIKKNSARPDTVGNKSPYTANYTLNVGPQYDAPISKSLNAMIRVDYRLTGPTWFHVVQAQTNPTIFGVPGDYSGTRRDAYGIFDVRAGISGEKWSLTAFGTNVLNKHYLTEIMPAVEFGGTFVSPGACAQYGLELSWKY
jgi:iron complex outermembrane receptor protein